MWTRSTAQWHLVAPPAWTDAVLTSTGHGNLFALPPLPMPIGDIEPVIRVGQTFFAIALWPEDYSATQGCESDTASVDWTGGTIRLCAAPRAGKRIQVVYYPQADFVASYCADQPSAAAQEACLNTPIPPQTPTQP